MSEPPVSFVVYNDAGKPLAEGTRWSNGTVTLYDPDMHSWRGYTNMQTMLAVAIGTHCRIDWTSVPKIGLDVELTENEWFVLRRIAAGRTQKSIAKEHGVNISAVTQVVTGLTKKLHASCPVNMIAIAGMAGLLSKDDVAGKADTR